MRRVGMVDTSPEARTVLDDVYRRMDPRHKLSLQASDFQTEKSIHAAGVRHRKPDATRSEILESWRLARLGQGPWISTQAMLMDRQIDNLDVVREVTAAFDRLGIAYALVGSWASSFYGEPRATRDADITVEPFKGREADLVSSFGPDYYLSLDAITQAVCARGSFNIINTIAGFKVDVSVGNGSPFSRSILNRRAAITAPDDSWHPLVMVTAEDSILLKLEWYSLGGESSERQWLDVQGIFRIQAERLDQGYLDHWAGELGVADLLADARRDSLG